MTDRPILFSAPMVRALLEGRKTQTRRLATSRPMQRIQVGDRLWVKETWRTSKVADELKPSMLVGGGYSRIWYEADRDNCDQHGKVRVSIHMPRWASRLTLLVTEVRVERLQNISEVDACAEGIERVTLLPGGAHYRDAKGGIFAYASFAYASLWNSLHARPGDQWTDNPEIIALSFAVQQRNINE
jgi:hypothetical protein